MFLDERNTFFDFDKQIVHLAFAFVWSPQGIGK